MSRFHERIGASRQIESTEEGADEHIDALAKRYLGADEYPNRHPAKCG